MTQYARIRWKHKKTGYCGHGEYLPLNIAQYWIDETKKIFPDFEYWLEKKVKNEKSRS